jgi:tetratricopeptide (TPR) repeat protein
MRLTVAFLILAAELCAAGNNLERAERLYTQTDYDGVIALLKDEPADARSLDLLGRSYFMQADYKKATDALEKAAILSPGDSMIQTWLGRAYGRRAETSFALSAFGFATKSREAFERAVKLDSRNKEAANDLFDFYMEAPGIVGGGVDKARKLLPVIAECDPENVPFIEARLYEEKKQFDKAEENLRYAVDRAPQKVGLVLNLARFLARRGRYEESEKVFQRAEQLAPDSPRVIFARAETYVRTERNPATARELLKKYLSAGNLTPDDPPRSEALKLLKKVDGS